MEGFVEADVQIDAGVLAFRRARMVAAEPAEARAAAEGAAAHVLPVDRDVPSRTAAVAQRLQDVRPASEPAEARAAETGASEGNLVFVRSAVLVIELALLFVAQDLVGFVDLLELRLIAAGIRMVLSRQLAVCLLDLFRRCRA